MGQGGGGARSWDTQGECGDLDDTGQSDWEYLQVLVGNRLHLAFKRQVDQTEAESYAEKNHMGFYEVCFLESCTGSFTDENIDRFLLWSTSTSLRVSRSSLGWL